MNCIQKCLMWLRLLWILPGIRWKEEAFRADLTRWKQILPFIFSSESYKKNS